VLDLDPSTSGFAPVRNTAYAIRDLLGDLGLVSYAQLTGSRGVHVVVPIRAGPDFDAVRGFARDVAELVVAEDPRRRTLAARKADRGRRVYVDVMRNAYGQTAVAPYAVRARPGAPVAVPVEWEELATRGMRADRYHLANLSRRTDHVDDPWAGLARHARGLATARGRLDRIRSGT
jgi:bifunctional non-homologous end joining protein LigD